MAFDSPSITRDKPGFLTPYLKTVPGMIGLHALTFFSVEGTALGPSTVVAARHKADQALLAHFSSNR
ncbi:hypothetical protein [Pseudomonas sp. DR48]|uniref:hypothetical protein n=1 Tax=Pseudomonas sp. DR48 TaxID=2871095 RepID=UPI001C9A15E7|nr:hypothetical protein [Pseudomonas sp. DR48]QZP32440.1 hypothetical protein K5K95_30630 [Pseudomonas sp. DR48]